MPASKEIELLADTFADNIRGWELNALKRIARRVKQIGELSPADVKALNNAAIVKGDLNIIIKELAAMTGENVANLNNLYSKALDSVDNINKPLYDYRNINLIPAIERPEGQAIINAFARSSAETMLNVSMTSALCTINSNGEVVLLSRAYTDIVDKAIIAVTSGTADFNTTIRDNIIALGGNGIRVNYESGITRRLDTVIRQNVLWGVKQASLEYNEIIGKELKCDGIEIDWHENPRPSHEFMQGQQFHDGGDVEINGVIYYDSTEARERLQDYNCYHFMTPIICGVSVPAYSQKELEKKTAETNKLIEIGGKKKTGYGWSQDMRKLEAEIRTQKTLKETAKAAGLKEDVKACNMRIKACMKKYEEISDATGIPQDLKRLSIVYSKQGD